MNEFSQAEKGDTFLFQVEQQQDLDRDKFLDEQEKACNFITNKMLPKASNWGMFQGWHVNISMVYSQQL